MKESQIQAIVFTSQTGNTESYARLLSERINIPYFSVEQAIINLAKKSNVIYLGWIMAGEVKGYKSVKRYFSVNAVCAVGMSLKNNEESNIRNRNCIEENIPLFMLKGGFYLDRLHGMKKFLMTIIRNSTVKSLSAKQDKDEEDKDLLDLFANGGTRVNVDNLKDLVKWYEADEKS